MLDVTLCASHESCQFKDRCYRSPKKTPSDPNWQSWGLCAGTLDCPYYEQLSNPPKLDFNDSITKTLYKITNEA